MGNGKSSKRGGRDSVGGQETTPEDFATAPEQAATPVWRKVLYERQPFEDNYVDPQQFLQELRENENLMNYQYGEVVLNTFVIAQQISAVALFCVVFGKLFLGQMAPYSLLYTDGAILLVSWIAYVQYERLLAHNYAHDDVAPPQPRRTTSTYIWEFGRPMVSIGMILVLLTPILSTLTITYSDDTIVALSILTMCLHVLGTDYSYLNGYTESYHPNLAVNSATFGVILMASRIKNPLESGALIAFGTICFSLSPIARHMVKRFSFTAHVAVTFLLFGLTAGCLLQTPVLCFFYVTGIVLVVFVIPWCFVVMHSNVKYQINGPWDEAKPTNSAAAAEWANAGLLN